MKARSVPLLLALLASSLSEVSAQGGTTATRPAAGWSAREWNPAPTPGDLALPVPCGGSMVFRAIYTSGPFNNPDQSLLDDRQTLLGSADEDIPAVSYLRTDYVAGPFEDRTRARYFLLGKYEVTARQYSAVMAFPDCTKVIPDERGLPASNVSWFDAVEFTRRYSKWLGSAASKEVPRAAGQLGFVRLPTEAEWEFAVRGGLAVSDAERGNPTFLKAGMLLDDYAWFAGVTSSGGEARPIGQRKPNPVGVHDMLGNVEEMMLEPFRMNKGGRLHGQPGAMVVRGGSFRTPQEVLRSATRSELPLFGANGSDEIRGDHIGFRVVIGASSLGDASRVQATQRQWDALVKDSTSAGNSSPRNILEKMARESANPEVRRDLQSALAQISESNRLQNELSAKAIKELWSHAATVRWNVLNSAQQLDGWQKVLDEPDGPGTSTRRAIARDRMQVERVRFDGFLSTYLNLIIQLAMDYKPEETEAQRVALKRVMEVLGDRDQTDQLEATAKLVTNFRSRPAARSTSALRNATIGERRWLAR